MVREELMEEAKESIKENMVLDWKVHLATMDKPYRPIIAGSLVVMAVTVVQLYGGNLFLTVPLALVLFIAVADYFLPMRFRITDRGAYRLSTTGAKFIPWEKVKNVYLDDKGVKLSVFDKPTLLEAFRGLYLYFGKEKDGILEAIKRARGTTGSGTSAGGC
jgi:hypothetical protein